MTLTPTINRTVRVRGAFKGHTISELESAARAFLMLKRGDDVRQDRVEQARIAIAAGEYDDDAKFNVAMDRMLADYAT